MNTTIKGLWLTVIFLAVPGVSLAGEIKIIDADGLTRAVKTVKESAQVVITLRADTLPAALMLSSMNGLSSDVDGVAESGHRYVFMNVVDGTWKINAADKKVVVTEVKILP